MSLYPTRPYVLRHSLRKAFMFCLNNNSQTSLCGEVTCIPIKTENGGINVSLPFPTRRVVHLRKGARPGLGALLSNTHLYYSPSISSTKRRFTLHGQTRVTDDDRTSHLPLQTFTFSRNTTTLLEELSTTGFGPVEENTRVSSESFFSNLYTSSAH